MANGNKTSAKMNYLYNLIYNFLILFIPFLTIPYISRIVGVEGVGVYSYTYSIAYYFMLFTMLGVNNYGNRTIAKHRNNKIKLTESFINIYLIQLVMGLIMLATYLIYVFSFNVEYKAVAAIQSLFIISAILDINWFYFGIEEFKKTITRNTAFKVANAALVFIVVKTPDDLWKYALIMSGMTLASQLFLWIFLKNYISFAKINFKKIKKHLKSDIILFVPVLAISIYKIMDKIMLGMITGVNEVGFYDNAEKVLTIPITIITSLGVVMLPRMSNIVSKGNNRQMEQYIHKSIIFVMFLSFAMSFGLLSISDSFSIAFFGQQFSRVGIILSLLSLTLPITSFANVIRTQYLIPQEKDKVYIKSVLFGAIANLILNIILIPIWSGVGACCSTIIAEFIVMAYQAMSVKKYLPIKQYIHETSTFFLKAVIMLAIIYPINWLNLNSIVRIIAQVAIGTLVYGVLNYRYVISILGNRQIKHIFKK